MSSNTSSSNLTSAFVDLATYDEPEKYMYGGNDAVSYFIKKVRKATWFSIAPTILSYSSGNPGFGQAWGHKLSRAGDYLLRTWLRVSIPQVTLNLPAGGAGAVVNGTSVVYGNAALRWTRNLGHNLIQEINLSFNDLVAERMDNYFLDFWAGFTVPAGKLNAYNNMIGNIPDLIDPLSVKPLAASKVLPSAILNIPLPFFYARDTGIALPTAAIPYNDMVHYITFRDLPNLLIIDDAVNSVSVPCPYSAVTLSGQLQCDMWAEYAIVSNIERSQMGKAPRDMLIEQVQRAPLVVFNPTANANIDIRFAHSIKALFFAVRNKTNQAEWSNYTCAQPVPSVGGCNFYPSLASDPIFQTSLYYENTARLVNMGSDYFSLVVPFYNAISVPKETGYHMISYSLDLINTNPMGSTNYGKLTNVSFQFGASNDAVTASTLGGVANALAGAPVNQSYEVVIMGMNHNIVRVSGGAEHNLITAN